MGNNLSDIKATAFESYYTRIGSAVLDWAKVMQMRSDDKAQLQIADVYGLGLFQTVAASPTASTIDASRNVITYTPLELEAEFFEQSLLDNPELALDTANGMADAAASTIAHVAWSGFASLPTISHPDNGTGKYGSGKKFVDSGFACLDGTTQGNKLTAAFSDASLKAARLALKDYRLKSGLFMRPDISNDNLVIVGPSEIMDPAVDVTSRNGPVYDGTGLVSGSFRGIGVVTPPDLSDANDWALIHRKTVPFGVWLRKAPSLRIEQIPGTGRVAFYSSLFVEFFVLPFEGGFIFSSVP